MRHFTLQALTWGTVAGSVVCALWLAAVEGAPPRALLSPLAGLDLSLDGGADSVAASSAAADDARRSLGGPERDRAR